jgi:hypothetical protein
MLNRYSKYACLRVFLKNGGYPSLCNRRSHKVDTKTDHLKIKCIERLDISQSSSIFDIDRRCNIIGKEDNVPNNFC